MRRRRGSGNDEAEVDMTPMLDIVFIMLIFFIVTATFLDETGKDFTQPPPPPDKDIPTEPKPAIVVFVNGVNGCAVDGIQTDCSTVPLQVEKARAEKAGAAVILRMDERAKHRIMVDIKEDLDSTNTDSKIEIIPATDI
ncbi:ExbD/TolR family protein [Robiginitomaculum antarcticum]|uniref:ExbD/TolR family protein n=1 Tax=Robiginitomaculum antarcticum TaxID=437507 RepID=UPI00035EA295|nr:biopolymer transporter ExbD [Robiginitomaculum antarcticum]